MKLLKIEEIQDILIELMQEVHKFLREKEIPYYMLGGSTLGAVRHGGFIPWDDDIDIGMLRKDYEKFLSCAHEFSANYDIANYRFTKNCDHCLTRIYVKNTCMDAKSIRNTKLDKRLYFDIFPIDVVPKDKEERDKFEKKILSKKRLIGYIDARIYNSSFLSKVAKNIISFILRPFRKTILKKTEKIMRKYEKQETGLVCSLCSQYRFSKQVMPIETYGKPKLMKFEDDEYFVPEKTDQYLTTLFGEDYMVVPPVEKRRKGYPIYIIEENECQKS